MISKRYSKGEVLLNKGEKVLNIFIILEGKVKIGSDSRSLSPFKNAKDQHQLQMLGPNEVIGLQWVDDRTRYPSDATFTCASDEVKCLVLHSMDYKDILNKF